MTDADRRSVSRFHSKMNEEEFIVLDRKLFDRLSYGSLGPITLVLRNGLAIVGDTKGIARGSTDDGPGPVRYWGRVLMTTGGEDFEVDYSAIAEVT